jgi:hypothetical protein
MGVRLDLILSRLKINGVVADISTYLRLRDPGGVFCGSRT